MPAYLLLTSTIFLKFSISLRICPSSSRLAAVVSFSAVALYQCTDVISTHLELVLWRCVNNTAEARQHAALRPVLLLLLPEQLPTVLLPTLLLIALLLTLDAAATAAAAAAVKPQLT
jgi:hypothetical protein